MADNVLALKGLYQKGKTPMQSRFSGSGDSNVKRFAYLKLPPPDWGCWVRCPEISLQPLGPEPKRSSEVLQECKESGHVIAALSRDYQLVGPTVEITGGLSRSARE